MSMQERQGRGPVPLRAIFGTYLQIARRYPASNALIFIVYAVGIIFGDIVLKLYYRDMFDLIATSAPGTEMWPELRSLFFGIIGTIVLFNVFFRIGDFLMVYAQANMLRELANYALERLQHHSYSFFVGSFTGSLVARVRRFVHSFETIHDKLVFEFWFTGIQLAGVFAVLMVTMRPLALFFALWCLGYLIMSYIFVRYRLRFDLLEAKADSAVTGQLSDIITNILNLKMFSSRHREMERFAKCTREEFRARSRAWYLGNCFHAIQGAAMSVLEIAGMYITLKLWMQGGVSTGTVVLVQSYFAMVILETWNLGRAMSDTFRALSDAEEMVAIIRTPLEVSDPEHPEPCRIGRGAIACENLRFRYREGKDIFAGFSLTVPAGQRLGIVGQSGSGKSTLFKLLLRFADVTEGSITIDGQDLRAMTQDDLRSCISYVPQEPILFHRSLYENIAYARPDATKEEVVRAAQRAHAHDFIARLPHGYDTLVGERGVKLSGGERQRIALARVILKNAPVLLLDEATSSLDSLSEQYIQEQLTEIMRGRTTIAIAHRISTIRQMDRIIVLQHGRIVEDGTHRNLLSRKGVYADLWSHQSAGFLPEDETGDPEGAEDPAEGKFAGE